MINLNFYDYFYLMVLVFIMVFLITIFNMEFIWNFFILIVLFIAYLKRTFDVFLIEEYYLSDETIVNLLNYYEIILN